LNIKRLIRSSLNLLPEALRYGVFRQLLEIPKSYDPQMQVSLGKSKEDLEAAFGLLYESYIKLGYCDANPWRMRLLPHFLLPTTSTVVAKDGNNVVGTLTMVKDCLLSLPSEKVFSVDQIRGEDHVICEITSLVVHPAYRRTHGGGILFLLLKFMYEYAVTYFGVTHLVISIHPRDEDFYRGLLFFERFENHEAKDYSGAPAICLYLDLRKALLTFYEVYAKKAQEKNFYHFFVTEKLTNLNLPTRHLGQTSDPISSLEVFRYLFCERTKVIEQFTKEDMELLSCALAFSPLKTLIAEYFKGRRYGVDRKEARFDVSLRGVFVHGPKRVLTPIKIVDVSAGGLQLYTTVELPDKGTVRLQIQRDGNPFRIELSLQKCWVIGHHIGFSIHKAGPAWRGLIEALNGIYYEDVA